MNQYCVIALVLLINSTYSTLGWPSMPRSPESQILSKIENQCKQYTVAIKIHKVIRTQTRPYIRTKLPKKFKSIEPKMAIATISQGMALLLKTRVASIRKAQKVCQKLVKRFDRQQKEQRKRKAREKSRAGKKTAAERLRDSLRQAQGEAENKVKARAIAKAKAKAKANVLAKIEAKKIQTIVDRYQRYAKSYYACFAPAEKNYTGSLSQLISCGPDNKCVTEAVKIYWLKTAVLLKTTCRNRRTR